MTSRAPLVYDGDGNPMRVRVVGAEAVGEVSGEGHYGYEMESATPEDPTLAVYFEAADADSIVTASDVLDTIGHRIERLERSVSKAETQYENPDCSSCGREMVVGSLGGGTITYGCYPDPGEDHDCPYYQEHGYANSVERTLRDVAPIRRELRAMERLTYDIEKKVEGA